MTDKVNDRTLEMQSPSFIIIIWYVKKQYVSKWQIVIDITWYRTLKSMQWNIDIYRFLTKTGCRGYNKSKPHSAVI